MAQTHTISGNNTTRIDNDIERSVTLHSTRIFQHHLGSGRVTISSGGWVSPTTATRLAQISSEWGYNCGVSRRAGEFIWANDTSGPIHFTDELVYDDATNELIEVDGQSAETYHRIVAEKAEAKAQTKREKRGQRTTTKGLIKATIKQLN